MVIEDETTKVVSQVQFLTNFLIRWWWQTVIFRESSEPKIQSWPQVFKLSLVLVPCHTIGFLMTKETVILQQHMQSSYTRLEIVIVTNTFQTIQLYSVRDFSKLFRLMKQWLYEYDYQSIINMCVAPMPV